MFLPVLLAGFLALGGGCTDRAKVETPVLGRDPLTNVGMLEDHSEALVRWARMGVRDAILVNVDTHDDIKWIPDQKVDDLRKLYENGDWEALGRADSAADEGLYNPGNFIYAAARLGIVRELYWVIPYAHFRFQDAPERVRRFLKVNQFEEAAISTFRPSGPCVSGRVQGIPVNVCGMEALPPIREPLLFSLDTDVFPPMTVDYGVDRFSAVGTLFRALGPMQYRLRDAVVAYSVNGGFLQVHDRWLGDVCDAVLRDPGIFMRGAPPALWPVLRKGDQLFRKNEPAAQLNYMNNVIHLYNDEPSVLTYVASAYNELRNPSLAYYYAERSCLLDRNYCYGLPFMGVYLAQQGKIDQAERFFKRGYEVNPDMNYMLDLYAGLLKGAKRYSGALHYLELFQAKNGSFPAEFMKGEIYGRMGEFERAAEHYARGLNAMARAPRKETRTAGAGEALVAALRFYEKRGDTAAAALRDRPEVRAALEERRGRDGSPGPT